MRPENYDFVGNWEDVESYLKGYRPPEVPGTTSIENIKNEKGHNDLYGVKHDYRKPKTKPLGLQYHAEKEGGRR